jgi:hypothetical protein
MATTMLKSDRAGRAARGGGEYRPWQPGVPFGMMALGLLVASCVSIGACADGNETTTATKPAQRSNAFVDRLGCGEYCQTAGGYGDGDMSRKDMAELVSSGAVRTLADGTLPVTVRCRFRAQCRGALLVVIADGSGEYGRSDLVVDAGAIRTIGVEASNAGEQALQQGSPVELSITADVGETELPESERDEWLAVVGGTVVASPPTDSAP